MTVKSLTGIIDYGVGNLRSVQSAVEKVGGTPVVTADHDRLMRCERLILPGVGAFAHGIAELKARGLDTILRQAIDTGRPLLGICLGMQMLATRSLEFGDTSGLGFTAGIVMLIEPPLDGVPLRLPHVAWKSLRRVPGAQDWFFDGVDLNARFYFIHSYAIQGSATDVAAWADHEGVEFAAVIARGNVIGTQFHPEKSGPEGLRMLRNFVSKGV